MSAELDSLEAKVKSITTASSAVIALCKGLADQIRAGAGDKQKMLDLAAELDKDATDLGQAVVDNTI